MTQLKDCVNLITCELNQATEEQETLSDVIQSFLRKNYQMNVATFPRSRQFIGAKAADGAAAGLILGDALKKYACILVSIFNLCDDRNSLSRDIEEILQMQNETTAILQRAQSANNRKYSLLENEVRANQENLKNLRDAMNNHLQTLNKKFTLIQGKLTLYKECAEKQAKDSPLPPRD